ncbi:substrate-binding domain-containing protein [Saccharopolyspora pogona]|uniref:substrate-binding domain-containing protein n=1 Tax=Saccharopolyspora pogona TaxID=333966 RepID=UPI0016858E93|nr:substrate-binding domain-containing protein [Saccharopolyspora pogona]
MFGQAVGVLHALRESGRRIPEDVSVIRYDDLPFADFLEPSLTTVAMRHRRPPLGPPALIA